MTGKKRPILCWGAIDWNFLFQRTQHIMQHLANLGYPVHYRNPMQVPGKPPVKVASNLWIYYDFSLLPKDQLKAAVYYVCLPNYAPFIKPGPGDFVIYDCADDFPEFAQHEKAMLEKANLVLCCSPKIVAKHKQKHPHVVLLPNGVDINHFQPKGKFQIPPDLHQIMVEKETVIGFTGALYHGWVDIELLYYLAKSRPEWRILVIGETYQRKFSDAPANLVIIPARPYPFLPSYMHCFDVGIIPFLDNQIARGADPIKLYEYLACGLPVVSRDLPFIEKLAPPLVYRYVTKEECLHAIELAVKESHKNKLNSIGMRLQFAVQTSWDERVATLLSEMRF